MKKEKGKSKKVKVKAKILDFFLFFIFYFLLLPFNLYACPMCGDILERGKDAVKAFRFSTGISWSILLMLMVPYSLVGGTIYVIWRTAKNKKKEKSDAAKS